MKSILMSLVLLASTSVYASKARISSLQGADHLVDTQTVFTNPAHINLLNPYLTFEFGTAGSAAEGGFLKSLSSGSKLLVYLGHQNSSATAAGADIRSTNSYLTQNNPVEVLYGTGEHAFGGSLSMVDNKKSGTKETTVILKYGAVRGDLSYYAHLAALSNAEKKNGTDTDKIEVGPRLTLGGAKDSGNYRYFGAINYGEATNKPGAAGAANVKTKDTDVSLGLEDRSMKTADADIYVGGRVAYSERSIDGKKINTTALPVFAGIEYTMTSWVVFRGSVSQNLLFGSTKDETATNTDADGIAANTTASAGLGFKYKNLTLDGSLTAAADGNINGNQFLTQASATYNF